MHAVKLFWWSSKTPEQTVAAVRVMTTQGATFFIGRTQITPPQKIHPSKIKLRNSRFFYAQRLFVNSAWTLATYLFGDENHRRLNQTVTTVASMNLWTRRVGDRIGVGRRRTIRQWENFLHKNVKKTLYIKYALVDIFPVTFVLLHFLLLFATLLFGYFFEGWGVWRQGYFDSMN